MPNWTALDGDITVKWSSTVEPTTGKRSRTFEHSVPARWAALIAIVVAAMLGVTIPAVADPGNPTASTRPDDQGDEHGQGVGQGSSQGGPNGQGRGNGTTTTIATTTTTGGSAATTTTPPDAPPAPVSSTTTVPVIRPVPPVDWPPRVVDPLPPTLIPLLPAPPGPRQLYVCTV